MLVTIRNKNKLMKEKTIKKRREIKDEINIKVQEKKF